MPARKPYPAPVLPHEGEPLTPATMAARQLARIRHVAAHGTHPAYDEPRDWLYDFFPDFPWDEAGFAESVRALRADPGWPAALDALRARYPDVAETMVLEFDARDDDPDAPLDRDGVPL